MISIAKPSNWSKAIVSDPGGKRSFVGKRAGRASVRHAVQWTGPPGEAPRTPQDLIRRDLWYGLGSQRPVRNIASADRR